MNWEELFNKFDNSDTWNYSNLHACENFSIWCKTHNIRGVEAHRVAERFMGYPHPATCLVMWAFQGPFDLVYNLIK